MADFRDVKIIFWGTPEFALPSEEALFKNGYNIAAVVTNPDEPIGRKQILTAPPVKIFAQKHRIPVFQPPNIKNPNFKKEIPEAELYIVAAYGKIIPKEILNLPRYGILNIHPSLLPRWRGPSPIQYTILHGDTETGVTIIKMDEWMDHGPAIAASSFQISDSSKSTYKELHDKLAKLGSELLIDILPKWLKGEITPMPQDDLKATYSKILKKEDGRIKWDRPAEEIERTIRAFNPWPGTWTIWPTGTKIYRIRIEEGEAIEDEPPHGSYGYLWSFNRYPILIKTGKGSLWVKKLTLGGKNLLKAEDFLRGHGQFIGSLLI